MKKALAILALALWACVAVSAWSGPLPEAKPEDVGMSSQRLERMTALMQRAVDSGDIPGAVVMIARKGKLVYQHTFGMQDKAKGVAMAPDSIFRAYSMTKPIVTVAAMTLVEEGRLGLHESISPVSARVQEHDRGGGELRPGERRRQLLHHPGQAPDHRARPDAPHLGTDLWRVPAQEHATAQALRRREPVDATDLDAFSKAIAKLPLRFEPGTTWEYSHSTDVLGSRGRGCLPGSRSTCSWRSASSNP